MTVAEMEEKENILILVSYCGDLSSLAKKSALHSEQTKGNTS